MDGKQLQRQYKEHLSHFEEWKQKEHADNWLLFSRNIGRYLSIDETSFTNGELYTIVTNKEAKGKKGSLVAIIKGTKSEEVIKVLLKIKPSLRAIVEEVTLDMANNMGLIVKKSFPKAIKVIDRFHVQQLACEALQGIRIKKRWEAIDQENEAIDLAKSQKTECQIETLPNGETRKQLLARARYLLYKRVGKWSDNQRERAEILFNLYPELEDAYKLSQEITSIYDHSQFKDVALAKLHQWHEDVEKSGFKSFNTASRSIKAHSEHILNYFDNRSTNASAESFNAKIKAFRSQFRGVRDMKFFLFRISNLYA